MSVSPVRLVFGGLSVCIGAAVAGALWVIALRPPPMEPVHFRPAAGLNSIQAVTLNSGEIFFGTLRGVNDSELVLVDVFEIQTSVNPQTQERVVQLVPRRANNWHAPVDLAIPTERIRFTESVGKDSLAARQIAQPPAAPPAPEPAAK